MYSIMNAQNVLRPRCKKLNVRKNKTRQCTQKKKYECTLKMDAPMYNALMEMRWMNHTINAQMHDALDNKKGNLNEQKRRAIVQCSRC